MSEFADRTDAGQRLAQELSEYEDREDIAVLGLPRGGMAVAFEVARKLEAPLGVFVVRKLGVPGNPELAMGAIASGGVRVVNEEVVSSTGISDQQLERVSQEEREAGEAGADLPRREPRFVARGKGGAACR